MKILLISYYFPPYNTIAAVRAGKFAKYLHASGHDIRVITAKNQLHLATSLKQEIPEDLVVRTKWFHGPFKAAPNAKSDAHSVGDKPLRNVYRYIRATLKSWFVGIVYPDKLIGWYPYAVREGNDLLENWRPDVIVGSYGPAASLMLARHFSKKYNIPWIADFRDLWAGNYFLQGGWLRRRLDYIFEERVVSSASGVLTVSKHLKKTLRSRYPSMPASVVYNGFDMEDLGDLPKIDYPKDQINVVYTGSIYGDMRDPTILFATIATEGLQDMFSLHIYSGEYSDVERIIEKAKHYGLEEKIIYHGSVPYKIALAAQNAADVLLLLVGRIDDMNESLKGILTGKFFEYIATQRPIIAIGPPGTEVQEIMEKHKLGVYAYEEGLLKNVVLKYANQKKEHKFIQGNKAVAMEFSRKKQTAKLYDFIKSCV